MTVMREVKRLVHAGELSKAYQALQSATTNRQDHSEAEVLRAELLERLGECDRAKTLAEKLTRSSGLTPGQLSACNVVLGLVDNANGDFDSAVTRMQRAVGIAQAAGDCEEYACSVHSASHTIHHFQKGSIAQKAAPSSHS